jgi:hypothetical protein
MQKPQKICLIAMSLQQIAYSRTNREPVLITHNKIYPVHDSGPKEGEWRKGVREGDDSDRFAVRSAFTLDISLCSSL